MNTGMHEDLERLRAQAALQDGQFATAQACALKVGHELVRSLRNRGETVQVRHGVWRFRAAAGEPDCAVTAYLACWPHGVISHASAARHHGLGRVDVPDAPHVTVPHELRRRPSGMVVHRSRGLPACDVVRPPAGGPAYTSLARTVCDLADPKNPWETLAILDDAVALGARPGWINQRATTLLTGRQGLGLLRRATAPGAAQTFRSWLERVSGLVYQAAGLPEPAWNVPIRDAHGLIGVVDALWLPWQVVAEKEGLRFHTSPYQRRKDAQRFNRLADAGYGVRRFSWQDVVHDPVGVAATVLRALQTGGADLSPALPDRIELPAAPFR